MNTQLSSKFAAIAVALAVNASMIGTVALLFSNQVHAQGIALAQVTSAFGFLA